MCDLRPIKEVLKLLPSGTEFIANIFPYQVEYMERPGLYGIVASGAGYAYFNGSVWEEIVYPYPTHFDLPGLYIVDD